MVVALVVVVVEVVVVVVVDVEELNRPKSMDIL